MTQYGVLLFSTVTATMRAEKLLTKAGFDVKLIPPPREFSMDCGVSVRFDWNKISEIRSALTAGGIEPQSVHQLR